MQFHDVKLKNNSSSYSIIPLNTLIEMWSEKKILLAYDKNRKIKAAHVEKIASRFLLEAMTDIVLTYDPNSRKYMVVDGHHRLNALLKNTDAVRLAKKLNPEILVKFVKFDTFKQAYAYGGTTSAHTTKDDIMNTDFAPSKSIDDFIKKNGLGVAPKMRPMLGYLFLSLNSNKQNLSFASVYGEFRKNYKAISNVEGPTPYFTLTSEQSKKVVSGIKYFNDLKVAMDRASGHQDLKDISKSYQNNAGLFGLVLTDSVYGSFGMTRDYTPSKLAKFIIKSDAEAKGFGEGVAELTHIPENGMKKIKKQLEIK